MCRGVGYCEVLFGCGGLPVVVNVREFKARLIAMPYVWSSGELCDEFRLRWNYTPNIALDTTYVCLAPTRLGVAMLGLSTVSGQSIATIHNFEEYWWVVHVYATHILL